MLSGDSVVRCANLSSAVFANEVMFVVWFVCWLVCLSVALLETVSDKCSSKSLQWDQQETE